MSYLQQYHAAISKGEITVGKKVETVISKLVSEMETKNGRWIFEHELAQRPIDFIERFCRHSKGGHGGKPFRLELFQKAWLEALFGFVDRDTGYRRFNEAIILVGRKNGKSTLLAALSLYMMIADGESGAEIFSIATKRDQAAIVFDEALNMVKQSQELSKHIRKRKLDLYFPSMFSTMRPLASESNTLDGLNAHLVVLDELHALRDRNVYDVMKQSQSARNQPLFISISTAGFVRESIFDSMYAYANDVVSGATENDRFLPLLYELDDREEWTDPSAWSKANPGLGTIKSYQTLAENVERAKVDPDFLPTVLTKDFNIRETMAEAWLPFSIIDNSEKFKLADLAGRYAVGGVDLSSTTDLTAATILIPAAGKRYVEQMYFFPEALLTDRVKEDKIPYDRWVERGFLTATPGHKVDYRYVTQWFVGMLQKYDIRPMWIGYDPWGSTYWYEEMAGYGFQLEPVRQGARTMSGPMREMAADLAEKKIIYNANPILKWNLSNVSVKRDDNDNIRPVKGQNQRARIDGAVSLINAYVVLLNHMDDLRVLTGEEV